MKVTDLFIEDDWEVREKQLRLAASYSLPEFESADPSQVTVTVLSGGITNQLYRVRMQQQDEKSSGTSSLSLVVRVFGKETERVISRDGELFYQALFLPTYCTGKNFLTYKFLEGFHALEHLDMPQEVGNVARALAKLHWIATKAAKADVSDTDGLSRWEREQNVWEVNTLQWGREAFSAFTMSKLGEQRLETLASAGLTSERMEEEGQWLLSQLEHHLSEFAVGICHNDLLSANVMRRHEEDGSSTLFLIDFEYCRKNLLLYDFSNHFNEYVGLACDYGKYFPQDDVIQEAVVHYRNVMRELLEGNGTQHAGGSPFSPEDTALFVNASAEAEAETVAKWVKHIKFLTLVSNYSWAVWSILQAAHSVIDFDFTLYATQRWGRYMETKSAFALDP